MKIIGRTVLLIITLNLASARENHCKYYGQDPFQCKYCPYYGGSQPVLCAAFNETFDEIPTRTDSLHSYHTLRFHRIGVESVAEPDYSGYVNLKPYSPGHYARLLPHASKGAITFGAGTDPAFQTMEGYPAYFYPYGNLKSFYMGCTLASNTSTPTFVRELATTCNVTVSAVCNFSLADDPGYDYPSVRNKTVIRYTPERAPDDRSQVLMQDVNWAGADGKGGVGNEGDRYCSSYTFSAHKPEKPNLKPVLFLDEIIVLGYYNRY